MKDLNSVGLVGVHEASVFPRTLEIYQKCLTQKIWKDC